MGLSQKRRYLLSSPKMLEPKDGNPRPASVITNLFFSGENPAWSLPGYTLRQKRLGFCVEGLGGLCSATAGTRHLQRLEGLGSLA